MAHRGLTFGIFLAPFHRLGENPTLAMDRDVELIQWLDHLGYDEAWIGEHHSAGWELIASPELIIAAAAEKTKHIKLGSGVTSLPYHHPFLVAQRWVQLDHMTRGRAMLGCGPGALTSDAYMLGIEPSTQRPRMLQSMDAIMRLLKMEDRVTIKTDWFEMNDAKLHLAPYSDPHFEIAVASTITPFGMIAAGTHGVGVLSIGAGLPGGPEALGQPMENRRGSRREGGQNRQPQEMARRGQRPHRRGRRAGPERSPQRRAQRNHHLFRGHARSSARPLRRPVERWCQNGNDIGRIS